MADYYSILNKTIAGLNQNTPELRKAVYEKARTAIENQLRRLDPFPGEEAIGRQLELLEEAVIVVEAEHGISPAPVIATPEPPASGQPSPEPMAPAPVDASLAPPKNDVSPQSPPPMQVPEPPATPVMADTHPGFPPQTTAIPAQAEPVASREAPQSEVPVADPVTMNEPVMADPGTVASPSSVGVPDELISSVEMEKPKRGISGLLFPIVILGLLASGAYAAWINRDAINDGISRITGTDQTDRNTSGTSGQGNVAISTESETTENKEEVRIDSSAQEPEEDVVRVTPEPTVIPTEPAQTTEPENGVSVVEPVEEQSQAETASNNTSQETSPTPLGEVAYLYEEGSAGAGATRLNASVNWEIARQKPSDALPPEPVIIGKMEVPGRGLEIEMNIKRNVDEALSASHIIELKFEVPAGFTGNSIDNVARFVMKPTEEARGEQLVAVPVKVSDGFFLFALDNLEQAVRVNQQLMLSSAWIDVPLSYGSGKRALLTMEKGGSGQQVFEEAFTDWQRR